MRVLRTIAGNFHVREVLCNLESEFCRKILHFVAEVKPHPYIMAVLDTMARKCFGKLMYGHCYTAACSFPNVGFFYVASVHTALLVHMFVHVTNEWLHNG